MSFSLMVLLALFLGIGLRQLCHQPFPIWKWMAWGALVVLLTGQIGWREAVIAIDWTLILFLLGMFIIGQVMEESGYLATIISRLSLDRCHPAKLAAIIVFGTGILSALFMNDTLAIIGTPLLIKISQWRRIPAQPLMLSLAFSITTGSTFTPIGNPQNLFIALQVPIEQPFVVFISYLGLPTLINLVLVYGLTLIWLCRYPEIRIPDHDAQDPPYCSKQIIWLCHLTPLIILTLVIYRLITSWLGSTFVLPFPAIALIPASLLVIASPHKVNTMKRIDWHTLIFFIALFILMTAVWKTSALVQLLAEPSWATETLPGILTASTLISQLISNIPLVALYLPVLQAYSSHISDWMALAAGSTAAGNLFIFGAASNLIIMQSGAKRGGHRLSFLTFAKYGIPLTIIQLSIYWGYLLWKGS